MEPTPPLINAEALYSLVLNEDLAKKARYAMRASKHYIPVLSIPYSPYTRILQMYGKDAGWTETASQLLSFQFNGVTHSLHTRNTDANWKTAPQVRYPPGGVGGVKAALLFRRLCCVSGVSTTRSYV